MKKTVVVVGDGWAATLAAGFLAKAEYEVRWILGTGARLTSPLPSWEEGVAVQTWMNLAEKLDLSLDFPRPGSFLREFRNKSFREPGWIKGQNGEERQGIRDAQLWAPEQRFVALNETRFERTSAEIEDEIRQKVLTLEGITRTEEVPVTSIFGKTNETETCRVVLGSGEEISCEFVVFADRWSSLPGISGLPKPLPFLRHRDPLGVLQATFTHSVPMGAALQEGFFSPCGKEAGEEIQRYVFGYYFANGLKSVWTLALAEDEGEDNHAITKKLRKLKQTLDKTFTGADWLPEGKSDFMSTVADEQVHFEEFMIFSKGEMVTEALELPKSQAPGVYFLTDGCGPSCAAQQAASLCSVLGLVAEKAGGAESQAE